MDPLERLLADDPSFHTWPDGASANWAALPEALQFLRAHLAPEMCTLETGCGQSTVVFGIAGTHHVCIAPDAREAARVRTYCERLGIGGRLTFVHESSDLALPAGRGIPDRLGLVLIDGAHRFPFPCLDFHYTEPRLEIGGVLALDDWEMPSVKVLYDFVRGEDEWQLLAHAGRTAFFRKVAEARVVLDCQGQNINKRRPAPRRVRRP